jgi:cytochrome c biogenesis protein CcmG/thiol:disulfide interchange protein DsbE
MSGRVLRWLVVPVIVLPLAWLLVSGLSRSVPRLGDAAPAFSLRTIDGQAVSSEELAGRPYLLNFWASWCIPSCVDEHPVLLEAQERFGDEVRILGVLYRDTPEDARDFLERYGDGGWAHLTDPGGRLATDWGVIGPPETYLVGADGRLLAKRIGPLTSAELDDFLAPAVAAR